MNAENTNQFHKLKASEFSKTFWLESLKLSSETQSIYHLYNVSHYSNDLDVARLKQALQVTVNTNYNLRSNFVYEEDNLKQIIHGYVNANIFVYVAKTKDESECFLEQSIKKPFCLARDQLYRFVIIDNQYDSTISFLSNFHHIILDGTQYDALMQQIDDDYVNSKSLDETDDDEIIKLHEYLLWENDVVKNANVQSIVDRLKNLPLTTDLSSKKTEKSKRNVVKKNAILRDEKYNKLKLFSNKNGCSVFNILKVV